MGVKELIIFVKVIQLATCQLEKEYGINDHIISESLAVVLASLLKLSKK